MKKVLQTAAATLAVVPGIAILKSKSFVPEEEAIFFGIIIQVVGVAALLLVSLFGKRIAKWSAKKVAVDWDRRLIQWFPITRHGSSWNSQDSHPHPVFSHAADSIWFTSDKDGQRAIYRLDSNR